MTTTLDQLLQYIDRVREVTRARQLQEDDLGLRRAEGVGIDVTNEQAQLPCEMLPKHNVIFFGRVDIMELIAAKVRECEEQGKLGAVTLYGLGGIGSQGYVLGQFADQSCFGSRLQSICTSFKTPWRESSQ
jgi:hypothetical protein